MTSSAIVGTAHRSYPIPNSDYTMVTAVPFEDPELWADYLNGAVRSYRKFGVEEALELDEIRDGRSTSLFLVVVAPRRRDRRGRSRTRALCRRARIARDTRMGRMFRSGRVAGDDCRSHSRRRRRDEGCVGVGSLPGSQTDYRCASANPNRRGDGHAGCSSRNGYCWSGSHHQPVGVGGRSCCLPHPDRSVPIRAVPRNADLVGQGDFARLQWNGCVTALGRALGCVMHQSASEVRRRSVTDCGSGLSW